ncbi:Nif3-like dinuclear metal center hexameric protein [Candidatus Haliotispira prima]|uniref:Nif3-like dinuclear metal center hexameric protein n=1 Tax=Candidatus Haliotispira prima TaxID=3034016 RepID=A0ABY8MF62_9SPIO|nr:Nif3-like dinuclear metal center hexameric protein [Candidatus Haliotispira prima]
MATATATDVTNGPVHSSADEYPHLEELVLHLDGELQCSEFRSVDRSLNGLQVGDTRCPAGHMGQTGQVRRVRKIAAAVDASLESFERAADLAADLLIVHHGIFWGQCGPVVGPDYQRMAFLTEKRLALYAAHLPLDAHMQYGNNIHLAERLGLQDICGFASYKGRNIGCAGKFAEAQSMDDVCQALDAPENALRLEFSRKGKAESIETVGIVSGAGALAIGEAAAKGYDLLLTGEISHQHYHAAKELGLSILAIGHYRSEMGGVMRLLGMLKEHYPSITTDFIDLPTGL